jgi:dihydrofolate synthase / folylpolyglutamate synthase
MYQRVGNSAFNKGLDKTIALVNALGNPHRNFPSVHIAGTNGKGSSSNMLAAILQAAGYKTGLYTSPHLKSFTERVKINGLDIPEAYLVNFVTQNRDLFDEVKPSFFEMTVALAFKYFSDEKVDIAIVEVGLGGRLDSTNIIQPLVSLITNISLDHQYLLGDDLVSIAQEKAGIMKPKIPTVISKYQPEVAAVFKNKAVALQASLYFADQEIQVQKQEPNLYGQIFSLFDQVNSAHFTYELGLAGAYQKYNLPGVLKVIQLLQELNFRIEEEAIRHGLKNVNTLTGFKGRWQVLNQKPLTICDTGHNQDGIKQIVQQLESYGAPRVHVVFGMVQDKDIKPVLSLLPKKYHYYFCQASIPRALPAAELKILAAANGLMGEAYLEVNAAYAAARAKAKSEDIIFIGGSTFVVADLADL